MATTYEGGILTTTIDRKKLFIFDNSFETGSYTAGGSPVTLPIGTVMGRIAATNKIVPFTSGASDGSQFPRGVLAETRTIAAGATVNLTYCHSGEIDEDYLILQGSDSLNTVVTGATVRDRIQSDSVGIILKKLTEMSGTI